MEVAHDFHTWVHANTTRTFEITDFTRNTWNCWLFLGGRATQLLSPSGTWKKSLIREWDPPGGQVLLLPDIGEGRSPEMYFWRG